MRTADIGYLGLAHNDPYHLYWAQAHLCFPNASIFFLQESGEKHFINALNGIIILVRREKNAAKHGEGPPIEWTGMETENEPSNLTVDRLIGPLGYPTAPDPSTRI